MYILWTLGEWAAILFVCAWILVRLWIGCVYMFAGLAWSMERLRRLCGREPHFTFNERRKRAFIASPACVHSRGTTPPLVAHRTQPAK